MGEQIEFKALNNVPIEQIAGNRAYAASRGLPQVGSRPVPHKLAVVGGGHSAKQYIEELRDFDGDVWAINGAYHWCVDNGIDCYFFAIDPSPKIIPIAKGVYKAVVADSVDPKVIEAVHGPIEIARTGEGEIKHGTTAASTAPMVAVERGHKDITFYGCESSYAGKTHMYKNDALSDIWVISDKKTWITCPQFIMQVEFLSELIRAFPESLRQKGGGFLDAMVKTGKYQVSHVSRKIQNIIDWEAINARTTENKESPAQQQV